MKRTARLLAAILFASGLLALSPPSAHADTTTAPPANAQWLNPAVYLPLINARDRAVVLHVEAERLGPNGEDPLQGFWYAEKVGFGQARTFQWFWQPYGVACSANSSPDYSAWLNTFTCVPDLDGLEAAQPGTEDATAWCRDPNSDSRFNGGARVGWPWAIGTAYADGEIGCDLGREGRGATIAAPTQFYCAPWEPQGATHDYSGELCDAVRYSWESGPDGTTWTPSADACYAAALSSTFGNGDGTCDGLAAATNCPSDGSEAWQSACGGDGVEPWLGVPAGQVRATSTQTVAIGKGATVTEQIKASRTAWHRTGVRLAVAVHPTVVIASHRWRRYWRRGGIPAKTRHGFEGLGFDGTKVHLVPRVISSPRVTASWTSDVLDVSAPGWATVSATGWGTCAAATTDEAQACADAAARDQARTSATTNASVAAQDSATAHLPAYAAAAASRWWRTVTVTWPDPTAALTARVMSSLRSSMRATCARVVCLMAPRLTRVRGAGALSPISISVLPPPAASTDGGDA